MNNPKTRKKPVSRSGKTLKTEAAILGLVLILPASLLALTYSSLSSAQAVWPITSLQSAQPGGASQLTFLDQQVFAFNVPNEWFPYDTDYHYWHEYSFGSIVPSNATMALCILKLTDVGNPYGGSDIAFCLQDPQVKQPLGWYGGGETVAGSTSYSMGADIIWFDGTVFAYVAIQNGQVWACNPGEACGVDVYVVGYVTEATDVRGFYFDFATQDYCVVMGSAATTWADISVDSILPSHLGYNLIGLYIALDSPTTEVDVSFRANGKTGGGITYETCTNDPGTHLIGLVPASDSGFQYKASSDAPISIYVEGFIFSCPLANGDKFVYQLQSDVPSVGGTWTTSPSFASNAKAIISAPEQSPGAMELYMCRASGASNEQISYQKNSCGTFCILTPLGANHAFEYWTDPDGDASGRSIDIGTIVLQGSAGISEYANQTAMIPEVNHDVAITGISLYRTIVSNRTTTSINVTVQNQGDETESFNVSLSYNTTAIGTQTVTISNGTSTILNLVWNTTGITIGNYTITASAISMPGETDTANNSLSTQIQVTILGDINGDGRVDMKDVSKVAQAFQVSPTSPKWVSNGDLDENGVIDMKDIGIIYKHFGATPNLFP